MRVQNQMQIPRAIGGRPCGRQRTFRHSPAAADDRKTCIDHAEGMLPLPHARGQSPRATCIGTRGVTIDPKLEAVRSSSQD